MGRDSFDIDDYASRSKAYVGRSVEDYTSHSLNPNLNPLDIKLRESRDSEANPNSTAIIIGLDLTGSMGFVLDYFTKEGLGKLCQGIYDKKPVTDPHVMIMGIGDVKCDAAPLQVTQFEAAAKPLLEQIEMLWVHHGGGGNGSESYTLPWFFAATRTATDCFEKRQQKGYLFTIGDEPINEELNKNHISRVLGKVDKDDFKDFTAEELLDRAQEKYNVYHIIASEGAEGKSKETLNSWTKVLGEHVIIMSDHRKLAETIITVMLMKERNLTSEEAVKVLETDNTDPNSKKKTSINFRK